MPRVPIVTVNRSLTVQVGLSVLRSWRQSVSLALIERWI
jgi:hypothetical protein